MAENTLPRQDFDRYDSLLSLFEQVPTFEALQVFKQYLSEMPSLRRKIHSSKITRLYSTILRTHVNSERTRDPRDMFVDSLRIVLGCEASLCDTFQELTLRLTPPRKSWSEYILSRVSEENLWDIRDSEMLMIDLVTPSPRCIVLLKYGYPYSFESSYFHNLLISARSHLKAKYNPSTMFKLLSCSPDNLRLQMALEILVAVQGFEVSNAYQKMSRAVLSVMWKTVNHPFISSTEITRLLAPLFAPQKIQELCEGYVNATHTIFDVPTETSPRSLLHLSRVQVRRNLLEAKKLSDVTIDILDIPSLLKEYLKLLF